MRNVIFQINGGIGKVIAATAVVKAIKEQIPDSRIIVISGYSEVFLNNPNVYRNYTFGQMPYFYSEHVEGKKPIVFAHDPYYDEKFVHQESSLIQVWIEMCGLKYSGQKPEIFLTQREVEFNTKRFVSDKPIMVMQTNGGGEQQQNKYSWMRDIPSKVVIDVIEAAKENYNIVHLKRQDQIGYDFTTPLTDNFRSILVLLTLSAKRLLMDSFAQHAAAALNLPSTVLWIGNSPVVFGYDLHDNILANPFTKEPELRNSYLQKFDIFGDAIQFPYESESEIFDSKKVIESLSLQKHIQRDVADFTETNETEEQN